MSVPALATRARAFALHRRAGALDEAGMAAVWLAREYRNRLRNQAVAEGWLARVRRLHAEPERPSRLTGWLLLAEAEAPVPAATAIARAEAAEHEVFADPGGRNLIAPLARGWDRGVRLRQPRRLRIGAGYDTTRRVRDHHRVIAG